MDSALGSKSIISPLSRENGKCSLCLVHFDIAWNVADFADFIACGREELNMIAIL